LEQQTKAIEHTFIGLNRKAFIIDILEGEFSSNIRKCGLTLGIAPNYLRDILHTPTRGAGNRTLSYIWQYCKKQGINPEKYIFIQKK